MKPFYSDPWSFIFNHELIYINKTYNLKYAHQVWHKTPSISPYAKVEQGFDDSKLLN